VRKNVLRILPDAQVSRIGNMSADVTHLIFPLAIRQIEECTSARSAMTSIARCGAEKVNQVSFD
jgi:hypothetical protein